MRLLLTLCACLVLASCSEPLPVEQELVIGDSYAKTCNPDNPPRTEKLCLKTDNAAWGCQIDIETGEMVCLCYCTSL